MVEKEITVLKDFLMMLPLTRLANLQWKQNHDFSKNNRIFFVHCTFSFAKTMFRC